MNLESENFENICVIYIKDRITSANYHTLESFFMGLYEKGETNFLFNTSEMNYISSAGLRVFLIAKKLVNKKQGVICISGLNDSLKEIFDISGFSSFFTFFKSQDEALEYLKQ